MSNYELQQTISLLEIALIITTLVAVISCVCIAVMLNRWTPKNEYIQPTTRPMNVGHVCDAGKLSAETNLYHCTICNAALPF